MKRLYNENTFITNFPKYEKEKYKKVIKESGADDMFILDDGYDDRGMLLEDMCSMHCASARDLSSFWRVFDKVNAE